MKTSNSVYAYPAVFRFEDGQFHIYFPDIEGCFTCGDSIEDGLVMAKDVLAFTIYENFESQNLEVPKASPITSFELMPNEFITYVACDTMEYRRKFNTKSVKKTLTIPEWLNEAAIEKKINFSQVLKEALMERIIN